MKTILHMASAAVLAFVWTSGDLRAQCTESLMFSANLTANDSYTDSLLLSGDLTSMTVNLDVVTEGGSYPSDLMMYILLPTAIASCGEAGTSSRNLGAQTSAQVRVGHGQASGTPPSMGFTLLRLTSRLMD